MDSSTFWLLPRLHIFPVGITRRCYPTPQTREIIHPSYQSTPRTRDTWPSSLPGPDSHLACCGFAQADVASVAAVGAAILTEFDELSNQAWTPRAAGFGGRLNALLGGSGRL